MSARILTGSVFDQEVEEALGDDEQDFEGWYCVATDPFPCPAPECTFVAQHMTAAHRIIVWAERDDPRLLQHAALAQRVARRPRVIEYEHSLGPCISYDQWYAIGRPIHGRLDEPSGWPQ